MSAIAKTLFFILFLISIVPQVTPNQQCIDLLKKLQNMLISDRQELLSGKSIDDLGFPGSCQEDEHGYAYSTVEVTIHTNPTEYTGYLGFCFPSMCSVQDLNQYGKFLINFIFAEYKEKTTGTFIKPPLTQKFSPLALVICIIFVLNIVATMYSPIVQWITMCRANPDSQFQIKSVYIDLENPDNELDEDRITHNSNIMQRVSLKYKWNQLWRSQESFDIYSFSLFRVLAIPLLIYGQIFWLTNFGAFNYYAFYEEIYDQFYVKFAIFSYYLPDIFFFISAFLFTRKILAIKDNHYSNLVKSIGKKLLRLYPLYFVIFIIYWFVTPALHEGPIWYVYEQDAAVCNSAWWRVLLLIDNWWTQGCYPALWFVQLEIQFTVIFSLLFFSIYLSNPKLSLYALTAYLITGFVFLFVFSGEMVVSVKIAINPYTQHYFKSFQSHLWFYLMGVLFAILAEKQSIRIGLQNAILDKKVFSTILRLFAWGILTLILFRPWVWWGQKSLAMELAICRIGTLLCFIILFLRGMFVKESCSTVIHKYGYYMYPVMLVSFFVVSSSFWSVGSFMYVSGLDIINEVVPNFLISYALGIFLGLMYDLRPFMIG